jgi:predicted metalloprotease with PDZ domain
MVRIIQYTFMTTVCTILLFGIASAQTEEIERHVRMFSFGEGPWIGVEIRNTSDADIDLGKLPRQDAVYVSRVTEESPADSAGIRAGDVILQFGERQVYETEDLVRAVRRSEKDLAVRVVLFRDGKEHTITVIPRQRPRPDFSYIPRPPDAPHAMRIIVRHGHLGVQLMGLNPQLADYFGVDEDKGILVTSVAEGSPAEKAGIRAGDVIVKIADRDVSSARDIRRALRDYEEGEVVSVEVIRERSPLTLSVTIGAAERSDGFRFDFGDLPGEFDIEVFRGKEWEEFEQELRNIKPDLEELHIELEKLRENLKEFKTEFPREFMKEFRTRRVIYRL